VSEPNVKPATLPPIDTAELQLRGVTPDLEARAIDVILRCGWPRPGDPLGIKPCIPVCVREFQDVLDVATTEGLSPAKRLKELTDWMRGQLRHQRYVMALYTDAVAPIEDPVAEPEEPTLRKAVGDE
jgi:hypothetical protein